MEKFENVSVIKKANVYFDGKVTSRTVFMEDGSRKTLGILLPGQYEFGTADKEHMEILAGRVTVLLPNHEKWSTFTAGQAFAVPANSKFSIIAEEIADYCCSYIPE